MSWVTLARRVGGILLFIVGVLSTILPVVPGWLLILLSLYLLSLDSPALRRRLDLLCARFPVIERMRASQWRLFRRKADREER